VTTAALTAPSAPDTPWYGIGTVTRHSPRARLAVVRFDDPHQAAVEFLDIRGVQELVGSMRIDVRTEDAGDQELGLRETLAQHGHEWNRVAEAEVTGVLATEPLRTAVRHLGQPRCQGRSIPAIGATGSRGDAGAKGRFYLQGTFDGCCGPVSFEGWGKDAGTVCRSTVLRACCQPASPGACRPARSPLVQCGGSLYPVLSTVARVKTGRSPAPNWRGICGAQH